MDALWTGGWTLSWGKEAGADAYLAKPFNANELRARVEKSLEGRRMLQEKFAGMMQERKTGTQQDSARTNDANVRFLAKASTLIYGWLERSKEVDVALVASAMCMSPRQFQRRLNALVGNSPAANIQRLKIKRARILMDKDANMSLAEVADLCGFDAYPNFVRAFKNVCGVKPTEYRRGSDA